MTVIRRRRRPGYCTKVVESTSVVTCLLSCALIVSVCLLAKQYYAIFDDACQKKNTLRKKSRQCLSFQNKIKASTRAWQINQLRRRVALDSPECMEDLYLDFVSAFAQRLGKKHHHLMMPEAGGDYLCELARINGMNTPQGPFSKHCQHRNYCAYHRYACISDNNGSVVPVEEEEDEEGPVKKLPRFHRKRFSSKRMKQVTQFVPKPLSCEESKLSGFTFFTNERWLDHDDTLFCNERAYSVSVRNPALRSMAHIENWFSDYDPYIKGDKENRAEILNVIQSNYMTWSLVGGLGTIAEEYKVTRQDLVLAKNMLERFDYIMDFGTSTCFVEMAEFMGMSQSGIVNNNEMMQQGPRTFSIVPPSQQENGAVQSVNQTELQELYDMDHYQRLNAIDEELYDYAMELQRVDCEFFKRIKKDADKRRL